MNWKASDVSAPKKTALCEGRLTPHIGRPKVCYGSPTGGGLSDLACLCRLAKKTGRSNETARSGSCLSADRDRRRTVVLFFGILSLLFASVVLASDEFQSASGLYDAGKYVEAATVLERITPKTAAVYFNLGNAHFRGDQLGRAVLDFERARQLAPTDPDILANLRFAEERLGVAEVNLSTKPLARFEEAVAGRRTIGQWAHHEVAGLWLTVLLVAGAIWLPRLRTGFVLGAVLAGVGLAVVSGALSYRIIRERTGPMAIVLAQKTDARFAPLADATLHFQLGEGTKICIREDRGQWWLVERADGQQGWIKACAAERVLLNHTSVW